MRAVALLLLLGGALGQMSMSAEEEEMMEAMGIKGQPMGRKNLNPQAEIFKQDLKYIYCGVCRKMVEKALEKSTELLEKRFQQLKKKRRKHETTEFDGEGAVQEYVEKMCNPLKPEGDWVGTIDLKHEGEALVLAQQPGFGKCQKECRTIEYACNEVLDRADTDFTEILCAAMPERSRADAVLPPGSERSPVSAAAGTTRSKTRRSSRRCSGTSATAPPACARRSRRRSRRSGSTTRSSRRCRYAARLQFGARFSRRDPARNSAQFGAARRSSAQVDAIQRTSLS